MAFKSLPLSLAHIDYLHEQVNSFQTRELIIIDINTESKEEASISSVHELVRLPFHEVGKLCLSLGNDFVTVQLNKKVPAIRQNNFKALMNATAAFD